MGDGRPRDTDGEALDRTWLLAVVAACGVGRELGPGPGPPALRAVAAALDAAADELVAVAGEESGLGAGRLVGELGRTTFQLRLFADVLHEGAFLRATIDRPDPTWPPAPWPDLRRMVVPLGPVVVFAASNFPFAFSVAGGDTASALAAGCPVVVKAHPGHLRLSALSGRVRGRGPRGGRRGRGDLRRIYGEEAGRRAVISEPHLRRSLHRVTGRGSGLFDLACPGRCPSPSMPRWAASIPSPSPARPGRRGAEILVRTGPRRPPCRGGQFCTKPGLLFVPTGSVGDEDSSEAPAPHRSGTVLLNEAIHRGYTGTRVLGPACRRPGGGGRRRGRGRRADPDGAGHHRSGAVWPPERNCWSNASGRPRSW